MSLAPQVDDAARRSDRRILALLLPVFFTAFGLVSLALGPDDNWDLANYHYYNAYAFLHDRMGHDIAPAYQHTYRNPLMDVPFYLMVQWFPPRVVGFLMGGLHGLGPWLALVVVLQVLRPASTASRWGAAVLGSASGFLAPATWLGVGRTFNDNFSSLFVLAALSLLLQGAQRASAGARPLGWLAAAGFVAGLGTGLKLTAAIYSAGLLAACWFVPGRWPWRAGGFLVNGAAGLAGLLVSGGFWHWKMWRLFENPIFPMLNQFFQSPYAFPVGFKDVRWFPVTWKEHLFYPFCFAGHGARIVEFPMKSYGFAVLYGLFVLAAMTALYRVGRRCPPPPRAWLADWAPAPLLVFVVVTYLAWQAVFSYYRYLAGLELVAPLAVLALVDGMVRRRAATAGLTTVLLAAVALFNEGWHGERPPWTDDWFEVKPPVLQDPDRTLILMHDMNQPTSFVIPYFPPGVRFLRTQDNGLYYAHHRNVSRFQEEVREILRTHDGPMYVLAKPGYPRLQTVYYYGLSIVPGSDRPLPNKLRPLALWEARRVEPATEKASP